MEMPSITANSSANTRRRSGESSAARSSPGGHALRLLLRIALRIVAAFQTKCQRSRGTCPARYPRQRSPAAFTEAADRKAASVAMGLAQGLASLDVAEALGRVGGRDTEGHEPSSRVLHDCGGLMNRITKGLFRPNHMVGGHHRHGGLWDVPAHQQGRQRHEGAVSRLQGSPTMLSTGTVAAARGQPSPALGGHHERPLRRHQAL